MEENERALQTDQMNRVRITIIRSVMNKGEIMVRKMFLHIRKVSNRRNKCGEKENVAFTKKGNKG